MKSILLFLTFSLSLFAVTYAQSAWDIGYIEVKDIDKSLVGRRCKPDFFPLRDRKDAKQHTYRYNLSRKDTVFLNIGGEKVAFVEHRPIYVDWGLYREQYLQAVVPDENGLLLRIGEVKLVKIGGCSMDVEAELEYRAVKERKKQMAPVKKERLALTLKKRDLQGLMFQEE